MHHAYFVLVGLAFAVIFWGSSHPSNSVSFMDSLFLVESAFTSSGLNTVNLSQLATGQQVILALMMILGSPVLISLFTIWFRAHIFEKRFEDIVEKERNRRIRTTGTIVGMTGAMFGAPVMSAFRKPPRGGGGPGLRSPRRANAVMHMQRAEEDELQLGPVPGRGNLDPIREGERLAVQGDDGAGRPHSAYSQATGATPRRRRLSRGGGGDGGRQGDSEGFDLETFIRAKKKSIGRNGQFHDLTDEERDYLGGVEYRSLRILFVIVAVYYVVFQTLGVITLAAWMGTRQSQAAAVNSQNPWWAGAFLAISSFNNAGLTLLDAGIGAFDNDAFVLIIVTILALAGNYAFPAFIRGTVFFCSTMLKSATDDDEYTTWKEAFDFILKYPRRLYMMMFPARANWIFVGIVSSLGLLNWIMLLVLSVGNSVLEVYPVGQRVGLALFQSLSKWRSLFCISDRG